MKKDYTILAEGRLFILTGSAVAARCIEEEYGLSLDRDEAYGYSCLVHESGMNGKKLSTKIAAYMMGLEKKGMKL